MNLSDLDALAKGLAPVVTNLIDAATAPLIARIAALEAKTPEPGAKGEPGEPGADGIDGKDAAPVSDAQIAEAVAAYLAEHPPEHGKDGADGIDGKDGTAGVDGKDGVGLAGAVIDRSGSLIVTLTDGAQRDLGPIVGKDGEPGLDGRDGAAGLDGKDGFSLDDFDAELMEDGRTVLLTFGQGEGAKAKELAFPIVLDRGVYKSGEPYARGDSVTWGGSVWIAQRDTSAKPEASDDWRLAVKRGRDGKDGQAGKDGQRGEKGEQGMPGRSFS